MTRGFVTLFKHNSLVGTIQSHSHTGSPLVLYRVGYHYDACLGTKPLDYSSFKHKVNEYPLHRHNNVVDRYDNASDCHDNVVDFNDNVYCHDDASVFHSNVGYSCRNMYDCHDNVFSRHDNVVDCHGDVSQDSSPCLVEICNEKCQLGISSSDFKEANSNPNGFASIHRFKGNHPKNMFIGHYNINSVRNKFYDIFPLFVKYDIDIIGVAETKLNNSFTSMQFGVANYKLHRQDRNSKGVMSCMLKTASLIVFWRNILVCIWVSTI